MNTERKILSFTMKLEAKPEKIFPLLCPVREYDWIESWKCEMVYAASGFAELDGIFKTGNPANGLEDTWLICRHESPVCIEFVRWNTIRAIHYTISLKAVGGGTESEWKQVLTGLTEEGNEFVRSLDDREFETMCKAEEKMLNHYLKTGEMLKVVE